jgi:hypothetical protein
VIRRLVSRVTPAQSNSSESWEGEIWPAQGPHILNRGTVRARLIRRFGYTLAVYSLVLLQVHLVWVAILHHHGETATRWHAPWVSGCGAQPSPAAGNSLPCTACQIVRHSAVQPATATAVFQPVVSVYLALCLTHNNYGSLQPASTYGRAPPLV